MPDRSQQESFLRNFSVGLKFAKNSEFVQSIIKVLNFTTLFDNEIKGNVAIDHAIITEAATLPATGENVFGPTLQIILTDGYESDSLIIKVGDIGLAK
ncbi:MAG: hypothetical protein ACRC8C_01690 [Mycoplasmoidaceae bacterium]